MKKRIISKSVEQTGLIPRSIIRTFDRFQKQALHQTSSLILKQFRISKYQFLVSLKCLFALIFVPWFITFFAKCLIVQPVVECNWNSKQNEIFLNAYQEKQALEQIHNFEKQLYFETLVDLNTHLDLSVNPFPTILEAKNSTEESKILKQKMQQLVVEFNEQSIESITNLIGDLITLVTLFILFQILEPQIIILKSFSIETIYSLNDTIKSFLLLLSTDFLVGFHSPRGWELLMNFFFDRFGLAHNQNIILLFVGTFPVVLDTVFKYWIFRYLNKVSPSTVATYHAMIE